MIYSELILMIPNELVLEILGYLPLYSFFKFKNKNIPLVYFPLFKEEKYIRYLFEQTNIGFTIPNSEIEQVVKQHKVTFEFLVKMLELVLDKEVLKDCLFPDLKIKKLEDSITLENEEQIYFQVAELHNQIGLIELAKIHLKNVSKPTPKMGYLFKALLDV